MHLQADEIFKSDAANPDRVALNTDVGFLEMMRFKGALPEVLNSRLAVSILSQSGLFTFTYQWYYICGGMNLRVCRILLCNLHALRIFTPKGVLE